MDARAQTIDSWLATHAAHQPKKAALRFQGRTWTYRALHEWVEQLAAALYHDAGLRRGERIAFYGHNSAAEIALFFAAARLGLILTPLNWRLAVEELRYVIADCGARVVFHGNEFTAEAKAATEGLPARTVSSENDFAALGGGIGEPPPKGALADPFLIVYTSGATGRPKGAVLTQEAVLWNALTSLHAHDFTAADHVLNVLPLFHVGGINIQTTPCFFVGGTVTLHAGFDPGATLAAFAADGITTAVLVPTMMRALMAHPGWETAAFPDVRMLDIGSTDVPVDILRAVMDRGMPMTQIYGATETGPVASYQRAAEAAETIGSIGRPAAHVRVRIVTPDGRDCAVGETGEIWVKGPNNFARYWNDEAGTEAALEDGWFKTGDAASRDADGLLWFTGRLKHVIISGGENIHPAEIERVLTGLPGIREVAVVGRPDPHWGEIPVAVVATDPEGPTAAHILAACDGPLARYKRPKDVVFVEALPRNALGKVVVEDVKRMVAQE